MWRSSTFFAAFLLLLLTSFDGSIGPSASVLAINSSARTIIEQVTEFKEEFKNEIKNFQLPKNGRATIPPMSLMHKEIKISKKHFEHNFFFDHKFDDWMDAVFQRVNFFFMTIKQGKESEVEAMNAVQGALDKLWIDQELMDRLDRELYNNPPSSPQVQNEQLSNKATAKLNTEKPMVLSTLAPNSITYEYIKTQMQRVYELRKRCNTFVRQMREQLWLRQPLQTYAQLGKLLVDDGKELRNEQILPLVRQIAEETNIYTLIPGYVQLEREGIDNFVFPSNHHMVSTAALQKELKSQLLQRKVDLLNYPLKELSEAEKQQLKELHPLAQEVNKTVGRVYARIEARIKQHFEERGETDGKNSESHFHMLRDYDLVNAISLVLHRKLQQFVDEQSGQGGGRGWHHLHQMASHDKKKKKAHKKEEADEFKEREMQMIITLWMLANQWLEKAMHSLVENYQQGTLTADMGEMLERAKDEWKMPLELDLQVGLAHVPNVRKRIFYCGAHLLFLYEHLNTWYDFETLAEAAKRDNTQRFAQLERELSELVEKEALLTPTGAIFYKNTWEAHPVGGEKRKEEQLLAKEKQQAKGILAGGSGINRGEDGETSTSGIILDNDEQGFFAKKGEQHEDTMVEVETKKKPIYNDDMIYENEATKEGNHGKSEADSAKKKVADWLALYG